MAKKYNNEIKFPNPQAEDTEVVKAEVKGQPPQEEQPLSLIQALSHINICYAEQLCVGTECHEHGLSSEYCEKCPHLVTPDKAWFLLAAAGLVSIRKGSGMTVATTSITQRFSKETPGIKE